MKYSLQRTAILLLVAIGAGSSAWFLRDLRIEQDNQSMQSDEAREDRVYSTFQREFDSEYELMVVVTRDDLETTDGLVQLEQDTEWLRTLHGIRELHVPMEPIAAPGIFSEDLKTVGILLVLDSGQFRAERSEMLEWLKTAAPERIAGEVHVVGLPLLKAAVASHIDRDQRVVTPLSGVAMMGMLGLLFRRVAGVVLPMLVVGLSLVTTLGLYTACGFELNSITSLLPPVVIVLSVSVAVHLLDAWNHAVDSGEKGKSAIRSALRAVWKPCVFTAAMTAAGLLSLALSPIPAVRLFGLFAAVGVSLSVIYAFAVLPIALDWTPERPTRSRAQWMVRLLESLARQSANHPRKILLTALLITAAAAGSAARIENNTDLIHFFKKHDPIFSAHDHVDKALGSVRSLDLLIGKADESAIDLPQELPALAEFENRIDSIPDVAGTTSIADFAAALQASPEFRHPMAVRLLTDDARHARMQVHLADIGSARASDICDRIEELAADTLGSDWSVTPTGAYYQVIRDSNKLVVTLIKSFGVTLIVVLLSTCLLFRSPAVLVPASIPNILPIIWGAGIMGLLGIDFSTATTMVAAVVIGLAVDDTIHYLHHFQTFRHLPAIEATQSTTRRIGRALVISSIVLVGGFWMGALGSFIPTNTFALLTGCMMISALLCDLLVLPAYLNLVHAKPHPKTRL